MHYIKHGRVTPHPDEIVEKILYQHQLFGHDRFLLQLGLGGLPHAKMLRAVELLGTKVAPVVRRELSATTPN